MPYPISSPEQFETVRLTDEQRNEVDNSPVRLFNTSLNITSRAAQELSLTGNLSVGTYVFSLDIPDTEGMIIDSLQVQ